MRNVRFLLGLLCVAFWYVGQPMQVRVAAAAMCGDTVCNDGDGETRSNCAVDCGCGNNYCEVNEGENEDNCPGDCYLAPPGPSPYADLVYYPTGGIDWSQNEPNPHGYGLDECFGNCGGGCTGDPDPCGDPSDHWWELEITGTPQWGIDVDYCVNGDKYHDIYDGYSADARWTYHGWSSWGCYSHDMTCPEWFGIGCLMWFGCGTGSPDEWYYDFRVISSDFTSFTPGTTEYDHVDCNCSGVCA